VKLTVIAVSTIALITAAPAAFAQGVSNKTPGHEMQQKGSKGSSPGASGYAPGQEMQAKGSKKRSPGASGYAPGQTSGSTSGSKSKY
jgi:opacity protein-like surface antigen